MSDPRNFGIGEDGCIEGTTLPVCRPVRQRATQRTCAFCEYFHGGGLARVQVARDGGSPVLGDCLNWGSPRFTTSSDQTCDCFLSDTGIEPWLRTNEHGEEPGGICCQRATGKYCFDHNPSSYRKASE